MTFLRPLRCALAGLADVLRTQRHARFHLLATLAVAALGAWLKIPRESWLWLITACGLVWMAEIFNTAIEILADRVTMQRDPLIGRAKDAAAGAVLAASATALAIGALVLGPPALAKIKALRNDPAPPAAPSAAGAR